MNRLFKCVQTVNRQLFLGRDRPTKSRQSRPNVHRRKADFAALRRAKMRTAKTFLQNLAAS